MNSVEYLYMVIPEFRQAISYSYDRKEFASSFTAAGTAGFGLINELYCYDPFTGALYRDSEPREGSPLPSVPT